MKYFHYLLFALTFLAACSDQAAKDADADITTLILVRHAEKADDGTDDPPLTDKGEARAALLKNMLAASGVDAVYSTPFQRNISTVKPLADTLGLEVITYDPKLDLVVFVNDILQKHAGQRVLICGHSNTVPGMLNALTGQNSYENLADGAYDNIFLVSAPGDGHAAGVFTLSYALDAR
jgi:broad specificity phosphatase PhoE